MAVTTDSTEVFQALQKLGRKYSSIERKALKEAGELVKGKLEEATPVWNGSVVHAKDHVTTSTPKEGRLEVGYDKEVAWRMHFVEFGTIKQRPQHFVETTQKELEERILELIQDIVRKELGL